MYTSLSLYTCIYIYIYIYIYITPRIVRAPHRGRPGGRDLYTASLRTKILDFGGFDAGRILILRGGIPRPIGNFLESLSQAILAGILLVGRLGVARYSGGATSNAGCV